jgi:hypothetical protein
MTPLRRTIHDVAREERGIALAMALGITIVIAIMLTTVIDYAVSNTHHASRSKADTSAYTLAEAGLNDAAGILSASKPDGTTRALDSSSLTGTNACPDGTTGCLIGTYDGGNAYYYGTLTVSSSVWTVTSWGVVRNPTGPPGASVVRRKVTARIQVVADASQPANVAAFNYLFATNSTSGCDIDLGQGVTVDYSVYDAGNLCLSNTAVIQKPISGDAVDVYVMGKIALKSPQNTIGSSSTPIDSVHTTGCGTALTPTHTPCSGSVDKVWANSYDYNPTPLISPTSLSNWTKYYNTAQPGPYNACTSSSGTPPPFGNQGAFPSPATNGSQASFNLTPGTAYSCVVADVRGTKIGEISWTPANGTTPGTLTVLGVIYCDCSMYISNNAMNVYNGFGTLYVTGTFTMTNSGSRLCASKAAGSTDCDFSGIFGSTAQTEMLVIAAAGDDGSGNSLTFSQGTEFQGGLIGIHNISVGQSSIFQGAMITPSISIGQSAIIKPLPILQNLPLGAPGNPTTHASLLPPYVTGGG